MKVGGSKVQLLLGIKNTKLDPVLIQILPSGVAVYRSLFKDVFGSRIIFGGPHKSFTKNDTGEKMSNAVFFLNVQVPNQQQLRDDPGTPEVDLIDFSVVAGDAGKGVAEELLTDLEVIPAELKVAEKPLIDLEMDSVRLERFRFQSCLNRAGYLETLEQKLLMDMDLAEKDEDIMNLEICKLRDGSDLGISDNLDELNGTRGDDSELDGLLGIDEIKIEMILDIDDDVTSDAPDDFRRTDEFRKTDDFKKTDELRKIDDFKRTDKLRKTDDFERSDNNPDRIEDNRGNKYKYI